jgi:hypothetical protein
MMNNENTEIIDQENDEEPIYFNTKRVGLVSDAAGLLSWIILIGFIADIIVQVIYLRAQMESGSLTLASLIRQPSFLSYMFTYLIIPLLTSLGFFIVLQAAAAGLNMLLDMNFNSHAVEK